MHGMRRRNLIAACGLLCLGVGYAVLTGHLPTRNIDNATGPSFFPWVITACFFALSLALLVQGLRRGKDDQVPAASDVSKFRQLAGLGVFVAYLAALPSLGFLAANLVLFALLMVLYGERRPVWVVGGACVVSIAMFFLFRDVFQIRLPAGILSGLIT